MKPKHAVQNRNISIIYNALYEDYRPIYSFYKFDIGEKVRIVKRKKIFEKGYTRNWSDEIFVKDKQLDTSSVTMQKRILKEKIYKVTCTRYNKI